MLSSRHLRHALVATTLTTAALAGCGADDEQRPDAGPDAGQEDAAGDAALDAAPDAAIDGPPPFVVPTATAVPLSAAGPDQLQSAIAGPGGTFYAAGYAAATLAGPRLVTVVKLTADGALDPSFGGGDGIATTTFDFRGGGGEIGLAVQPDGKLIVSATVANSAVATDRDVLVARLDTSGNLDNSFGVGGDRILDLNAATDNGTGTLVGFDAARGVAVGAGGVIYVYAQARAAGTVAGGGPRLDTDLTVVKLSANGAIDGTFGGGDGRFTQDLQQINEVARGLNLLADGSVLISGYANTPGLGTVQPVLAKLTPAGVLVPGFATGGVYHDTVLAVQTEIYDVAVHGGHVVTAGYGRQSGMQNDWVSLRFELATGARDTTWGGAANGAVLIDPSGTMVGDNCRDAVALPGGRTLLIGSTGPSNMPAQDAVFAVLSPTGTLDAAFGDGVHQYPLGANGNDQFWGGAVSGNRALVVGYEGGGATPTVALNDNAYAVVIPLPCSATQGAVSGDAGCR